MKTCPKCQVPHDTPRCVPCAKAAAKIYYLKNRDRILDNIRRWRTEHADRVKELNIRYRAENKEAMRAADREWYSKNKARVAKRHSAWAKQNREHLCALAAKYHRIYPERDINKRAKRRDAVWGNGLPSGYIKHLYQRQNGVCPCCGRPLGDDYHLDHIMPIALGGMHAVWNVQLLRAECNMEKGAQHPDDFMWKRGFDNYHARSSDFTGL